MKNTWRGRPTHWTRAGGYLGCLVLSAAGMVILFGALDAPLRSLPIIGELADFLPWLGWALFILGFALLLHIGINVWYTRYTVSPDYIRLRRNYLLGKRDVIRMHRVKDVQATVPLHYHLIGLLQPGLRRRGGVGTVRVVSLDHTDPELTMAGVCDPMRVKELLLVHQQAAIDRYGAGLLDVGPRS